MLEPRGGLAYLASTPNLQGAARKTQSGRSTYHRDPTPQNKTPTIQDSVFGIGCIGFRVARVQDKGVELSLSRGRSLGGLYPQKQNKHVMTTKFSLISKTTHVCTIQCTGQTC